MSTRITRAVNLTLEVRRRLLKELTRVEPDLFHEEIKQIGEPLVAPAVQAFCMLVLSERLHELKTATPQELDDDDQVRT